jgi:hypothetical protein
MATSALLADGDGSAPQSDRYRWTALSNTTLGVFMATLDSSIVIISLPAIFRGIHLNPLEPGNIGYLLWILMGYLVVTAVLVVTFGRIGDIFGRVRMYNLGFLIFTLGSIALSLTWSTGAAGATELIVFRIAQGIGGALLWANATAILTDAFPVEQRGMAMGINLIAGLVGSFTGLVVGGVLADVHWRLVFWINVPFGLFGTVWAYAKLRETGRRTAARIDWWGNVTFGAGLVMVLVGITYGIQPRRWTHDGMDQPVRAHDDPGRHRPPGCFHRRRDAGRPTDVRPPPVPDPRVHGRQRRRPALLDRPRWAPVHARDLATGDLAPPARVQLRLHTAVGGPIHAAGHGGLLPFGAALGVAVGPLRSAPVRDRRHGPGSRHVRVADAPAGGLLLSAVRDAPVRERHRVWSVRRAEHDRDHERGAGRAARRGVGDARDLPEQRDAAVDRGVLLTQDR